MKPMKHTWLLLTLALLLALPAAALAQASKKKETNNTTYRVKRGDDFREYVLHKPAGWDGVATLPLVIFFHSPDMDVDETTAEVGFSAKADKEKFFLIYPLAAPPPDNIPEGRAPKGKTPDTQWNAGGKGYAQRLKIDDLGFIKAILDDVAFRFPMDKTRIYMVGFDNGGSMAMRAAAELSPRVAAVAAVGAYLQVEDLQAQRPISLLYMHGMKDKELPYAGQKVGAQSSAMVSRLPASAVALQWAKMIGAPEAPTLIMEDKEIKQEQYGPGKDGAQVLFYSLTELDHLWPGGKTNQPPKPAKGFKAAPGAKPVPIPFNATDAIWEFFKKQTLPK